MPPMNLISQTTGVAAIMARPRAMRPCAE
jgi:hypothetical protein